MDAPYQIRRREYNCPSCLMFYASRGESAEDAALNVYSNHIDPGLVAGGSLKWDTETQTLHTGAGIYLEVLDSEPVDTVVMYESDESEEATAPEILALPGEDANEELEEVAVEAPLTNWEAL